MAGGQKDFQVYLHDAKTFQDELTNCKSNGTILVVDVHATWCGPCKAIVPYFKKFFFDFGDKIRFLVVEAEKVIKSAESEPGQDGPEGEDTSRQEWLKVLREHAGKSQPVFLFYKGGRLRYQVVGVNIPVINKHMQQFNVEISAEQAAKEKQESQEEEDS
eukprot:TRINITY_DN693_c0_g1_i1.p1 TRINITY_DN693_c0_g1~~TRINITY_DN693_c0_g1_i1.p1  ORF type:complete len:160 (+),score=27.76 TRINITY_DN693_c0_g1_i1:64-543(+)